MADCPTCGQKRKNKGLRVEAKTEQDDFSVEPGDYVVRGDVDGTDTVLAIVYKMGFDARKIRRAVNLIVKRFK